MKSSLAEWSRLQSAEFRNRRLKPASRWPEWGRHSCLPSSRPADRNVCLTLKGKADRNVCFTLSRQANARLTLFRGWQAKACLTLGCLILGSALQAAPPVVSNVTAAQRSGTKLVDIYYTVSDADGDPQLIQVQVSADAGLTYTIPCVTLSGDVGSGVTVGSNKHIVWNAGADWNGQFVPSCKVRVTANDGTTPAPPPGMVYIPPGTFQMGDNLDGMTSAMPAHNVQVDGFFMDRLEVSKEVWQDVQTWSLGHGYSMTSGNFYGPGHPVKSLLYWYDAVKWCNARSEKEGLIPVYYTDDAQTVVYRGGTVDLTNAQVKWTANGHRLPTEAEWEKAARGGVFGQRYPWGNTINGNQANYTGSGDPFDNNTTPVGYYNGSQVPAGIDMANGYGLYDIAGNAAEWCWDRYDANFYSNPSAISNPRGPDSGIPRVIRGGSFFSSSSNCRVAIRGSGNGTPQNNGGPDTGFRCVRGL